MWCVSESEKMSALQQTHAKIESPLNFRHCNVLGFIEFLNVSTVFHFTIHGYYSYDICLISKSKSIAHLSFVISKTDFQIELFKFQMNVRTDTPALTHPELRT